VLYLLSYAKWQGSSSFYGFLHGELPTSGMELLPPVTIKNGSQQISHQMVKQCIGADNVILNQPVSCVSFINKESFKKGGGGERNVYVTTKAGQTYTCSHVIMAIAPNILREVEFSPNLEHSKRHLLSSMTMGCSIKFIITYKESYWLENGFSGEFVSNGGPITWLTDGSSQNSVPTLVGLLGGRLAVFWSRVPEEDLKVAILDQLSVIFGGSWALEPTGMVIKNWQDEPFIAGGTVCFPAIGTMHEYSSIRASHGPIYFAGTETATQYMGTMAGAVQAGQRAAIEILDELRPQSLTSQDYFLLKEAQAKYTKNNMEGTDLKPSRNRWSYSVYRWTVVLPATALIIAYTAVRLRAMYSHLSVPKW
jgi:monoamine oxidase